MPFGREKRVLDFVNHVRSEHGREPLDCVLPGERYNSAHCPISESIRYGGGLLAIATSPGITWVQDSEGEADYPHPEAVREWIADFDDGRIPELEV